MLRTPTGRARRASGWLACLIIVLAPSFDAAAQDDDSSTMTTETLVQLALTDNPELAALHARWTAALERAEAAGAVWPQPRISYSAWLLAVETRQGPQRHVVSYSQTFPSLRALRDADDPALAEAEAIAADFDAAVLRTAFEVYREVLHIARIDALMALMEEQRTVYEDVAEHESAVMPFGGAEHGDLLRTTLMIEVLGDRIADLVADRELHLVALRGLARLSAEVVLDVATPPLDVERDPLSSIDEMMAAVSANDPRFVAFEARVNAQREEAEFAMRRSRPTPTASIGWGIIGSYETPLPGTGEGGQDTFLVGLSLPIPVFRGQYRHARDASLAAADAVERDAERLTWEIRTELERATSLIAEARERIERYERSVLPAASDATDHYAIAIAQGAGHHTQYLLAFEQELRLRIAVVDAQFTIALEEARIDWLMGGTPDGERSDGHDIETYGDES